MPAPALLVIPATRIIVGYVLKKAAGKLFGLKAEAAVAWFTGGLWGLIKWAGGKILGQISVRKITSWLWQAKDYVWNFNFNITDDQIDAQIGQSFAQLASYVGGALGSTLGWMGCGVIGTSAIAVFNPAAAVHSLDQVKQGEGFIEEALEEITAAWSMVLTASVRTIASSAFLYGYKNIRKLLKSPGLRPLTEKILGRENLDKWGAANSPTVSLRSMFESTLDRLFPIEWMREAVEEFFEEMEEACREATMLLAEEADEFIAQQVARQATTVMGEQRTVEIFPNRETPEETVVLSGRQNVLIPVVTTVMAMHQMVEFRDVGDICGEPAEQRERRDPHKLSLVLKWTTSPRPPFRRTGDLDYHEVTVTIPDFDRAKIDWQALKLAMGGANGFRTGRYNLSGQLSNGSSWFMWGGSHAECEQMTRQLLAFSNAELISKKLGFQDETRVRNRQNRNIKYTGQVYPHHFKICYSQVDSIGGRIRILDPQAGKVKMQKTKFLLWTDQAPINFNERVAKLFRREEAVSN